jgi:hypothetical protein
MSQSPSAMSGICACESIMRPVWDHPKGKATIIFRLPSSERCGYGAFWDRWRQRVGGFPGRITKYRMCGCLHSRQREGRSWRVAIN